MSAIGTILRSRHDRLEHLKYDMFHGFKREHRARILASNDVVLTTYPTTLNDMKDNGTLYAIKWKRIVLDKSKQSQAVCLLFRGREPMVYNWDSYPEPKVC